MRIAYFDTIGGISGDMTLGALVDTGLPLDHLTIELKKLPLTGYEIEARHIERNGITSVKLDVVVSKKTTHRHYTDIIQLIDSSELSMYVKETSKNIFKTIGEAEGKIHNVPLEKVHFHEVGAVDSIVDIVGTAIGLEYLGIEGVFSSPVKLGSGGFTKTEHGNLPVPSPAALEILRNYPVILTDIPYELTTPTGAAIIKTLSKGILNFEEIIISSIGYGSGTREIEQLPNLLRICVGEYFTPAKEEDIVIVETNIDDMNPEIFPFVLDKLFENGARDAFLTHVTMKKGRPGFLLTVMTETQKLDAVIKTIHRETTSIGVRYRRMQRKILYREENIVNTEFGPVKMKAVEVDGKIRFTTEFEECKRIAMEYKIPLVEVYRRLSNL